MTEWTENLDIDSAYSLSDEQIARFRSDGFIKLKDVFAPETLSHFGGEITAAVDGLNREERPLEQRDTYARAFLQITNLWQESEEVRTFVFGRMLAQIATELLGTRGVRLYHDQALYKEPGGGHTPWHVDQYYWPLSNNNTVTAWVPLQEVPAEMGPLEFSVGSQEIMFGRDLEISDRSEELIAKNLKISNLPMESSPFDLGEVSFHYGFTFHRAGPNSSDLVREVMTVIFMDRDMELAEPKNKNQQNDWDTWMAGARGGEGIDTPLNPVLYSREG